MQPASNKSVVVPYMITTSELADLTGSTVQKINPKFDPEALIKLKSGKTGVSFSATRNFLTEKGVEYGFKVVAHVNLKGGIGKTTSAITAATRAVQYGFTTCILDLDSQGSATVAFDMIPQDDEPVFCDIWKNPKDMLMGSLKQIQDNLFILPSSLENGLLDLNLMNPAAQKDAVADACRELKQNGFDLVIIDCPPSLGAAVISSICAADTIVIPVCHDAFSFKGLELSLNEIKSICKTFNLTLPEIKILFTKYDRRVKISNDALKRLSSEYPQNIIPVTVRTSTEYSKALENRETVFASGKKSDAKTDYDRYVRHLLGLTHLNGKRKKT